VRYRRIELENQFNELLTATVSHEMRTPLNSMLTLIHSLKRYVQGARGLHIWNTIQSSSMILQYLVNDMLDLYLIKNGKFKKNEQMQDIAKEISSIIEIMQIPCQQKNLKLLLNLDP
jgi:signal transduction histidine kinase